MWHAHDQFLFAFLALIFSETFICAKEKCQKTKMAIFTVKTTKLILIIWTTLKKLALSNEMAVKSLIMIKQSTMITTMMQSDKKIYEMPVRHLCSLDPTLFNLCQAHYTMNILYSWLMQAHQTKWFLLATDLR